MSLWLNLREECMKSKRFDEIFEETVSSSRNTLTNKAVEYSSEDDRMHNFKVAGAANTTTPTKALFGMYLKHYVSVKDIADRVIPGKPETYPTMAMLNEKIGDSINYMILLKALVMDAIENTIIPISEIESFEVQKKTVTRKRKPRR
jgi:hypothetical protein